MNLIKIRSPEVNHPDLFDYTVSKFINGFRYNSINIIELNSISNLAQYNRKDNIIFISAHTIIQGKLNYLEYIGKLLEECVFICFHFNRHKNVINNMPFKKYILTGEHHLTPQKSNLEALKSYEDPRWVPFRFAADLDPSKVGTYQRSDVYKSYFIGPTYANEYGMKYRQFMPEPSFLHNTFGRRISEEDRLKIILSSRTCLAFHAEGNVVNGNITERVFEGLAYGNAVISENPSCELATDGVCKHFTTSEDMVDLIERYWTDDNFFKNKQQEGYNFALRDGLYYHRAKEFLGKIKSLYG